ncbi:MAG: ATP-binding cassette domain-containing protein [Cellulosilyticum sp.]|nr:ATP-binding cassette domain-containing protein [Cellulosilyticum sp.]
MNAIEIRNLSKSFRGMYAVDNLNMTVPVGAIYGFIGENGSGKSTTEKLICGHLVPDGGEIKLFGRDYTDAGVRVRVGALIENAGCFPGSSVYQNLMMQAINLNLENPDEEIRRVLKIVRMEDSAKIKFKSCSLGMKQRIGIAMALLGNPTLIVLDEPINGLDADGMRIMREVLVDITSNYGCTVVISSHVLGELEKIATHYGIVRGGKMIAEMTAEELETSCRTYVALQAKDMSRTKAILSTKYSRVEEDEAGYIRVYDKVIPEDIVNYLYSNDILISEIKTDKIGLEEYYINLMNGGNSCAPTRRSHFSSKNKEE